MNGRDGSPWDHCVMLCLSFFCLETRTDSGTVRSKGEMCQAIGAQLLVDDSLKYALQVAGDAGIEVLLFGTRGGVCWCVWGGSRVGMRS